MSNSLPMDYTVHGILQARMLEWVAILFSRGSSQPRDQTQVSRVVGRFFTTSEAKLWFFSSGHVWTWELDHKEGWGPNNWCFWIVMLENTLESLLDCKEIKPVTPKANQPWIFIRRTDAEAQPSSALSSNARSQLIGKDPDAGKDWGQDEKGTIEDEMVGWHHWLNEHEFEQIPGDSERQGSLVCCSSWGLKESDMT